MAATVSDGGGGSTPVPATGEQIMQAVFGWMALFVMLIVVSDVPGLGDLAAGIAWLLLLSILIIYGPAAFANINRLVGGSS